jgi:c-di-GMP phosphodiesterase
VKDIFVARQPIFDAKRNVVAYELLYRSDGVTSSAQGDNPQAMSSSVLVDGVIGLGLEALTDGHLAYINLSEEMLLTGAAELLDPSSVVIEILESVPPTPEIIEACQRLVEKGYRLALDDFVFGEEYIPLLELAGVVKVDVLESADALDDLVERLRPYDVELLAEKVEKHEVHQRCVELGFAYFQGFHYFRPETITKKDFSAQAVSVVRLMNMLQDVNSTDRTIEEAFRSDPSLTYKLMRIVNSASVGGRGVKSIAHALRLLGRESLYRWMCLLMMTLSSDGGEMRVEMIKSALLRAKMSETLGERARSAHNRDIPDGGALFLIGLFSQIDQILGAPVDDILKEIDVSPEVRDALTWRQGKAGLILNAVEAYEEADWTSAQREVTNVGGDPEVLPDLYLDALAWAGDRMASQEA